VSFFVSAADAFRPPRSAVATCTALVEEGFRAERAWLFLSAGSSSLTWSALMLAVRATRHPVPTGPKGGFEPCFAQYCRRTGLSPSATHAVEAHADEIDRLRRPSPPSLPRPVTRGPLAGTWS